MCGQLYRETERAKKEREPKKNRNWIKMHWHCHLCARETKATWKEMACDQTKQRTKKNRGRVHTRTREHCSQMKSVRRGMHISTHIWTQKTCTHTRTHSRHISTKILKIFSVRSLSVCVFVICVCLSAVATLSSSCESPNPDQNSAFCFSFLHFCIPLFYVYVYAMRVIFWEHREKGEGVSLA